MAGALKNVMMRLKHMSLRRRSLHYSYSDSDNFVASEPKPFTSTRLSPSGFVFVYVGLERKRFVIPSRFINLPILKGLLKEMEEEFGLRSNGGLILPCEVALFADILKHLKKDERKYGKFSLEEFVNMVSDEVASKENIIAFTPLLQKAKV